MISQSQLVNATRQNDSLTENGAVTNSTSLSSCLDLFFFAGACRTQDTGVIERKLEAAWVESPEKTLRIIFWAGDIRGGAGERRFFVTALKWLDQYHKEELINNLFAGNIEFYNRWDSMFELYNCRHEVYSYVERNLEKGDGLLAKWMPRRDQHQGFGYKFQKFVGWNPKFYRKTIVGLSKTVEQQMCAKKWGEINYQHVPSVAMNKYRKAFSRNDATRFVEYLAAVKKGDAKINAGAIFPYDIYRALRRGDNEVAVETQWDALPNYMEGNSMKILPICDVSGSMRGTPMDISVSLGIYISERNEGIFKDAYVTFSATPKMNYLRGSFAQRARYLQNTDVGYNTNLRAVFDMLLDTAVRNRLPESEMPDALLIITDCEFDNHHQMGRKTNFQVIEEKYARSGYKRPVIVFWNVNARQGKNVPVKYDQNGTALISGSSPTILKGLLSGSIFNPQEIMDRIVCSDRYDRVVS